MTTPELRDQSQPQSLNEQFNCINSFLITLRRERLGSKSVLTPEEAERLQKMVTEVAKFLPPSIKHIDFPNGIRAIIGSEDSERTVEWNLGNIRSFNENVWRMSGLERRKH